MKDYQRIGGMFFLPVAVFIVAFFVLAITAGCAKDPVSTSSTNNADIPVSLLFTHDGCNVYRFRDAGHPRYFVKCKDAGRTRTEFDDVERHVSYNASTRTTTTTSTYIPQSIETAQVRP